VLRNREGKGDFDVRWAWAEQSLEPGFTAVVRVRDEARSLPWVLPQLFEAVTRVLLVDNGSTDGSGELASELARDLDAEDRLEIRHYPFPIARCGAEHLATPARSVHSLTYFYNWSFSQVRTRYALKWDGDMVLTDALVGVLRGLSWQLEAHEAIVRIPRHPLYVADERRAYLDIGFANREPWGWPNGPDYRFEKAIDWELSVYPPGVESLMLPRWSCIELKHLDLDEFSHWSHSEFDASARTRRKRREWSVFHALANAEDPPDDDVVRIDAPPEEHVIDYVRSVWLPAKAAEEPPLGERLVTRVVGSAA
jgi:glycosyltransferase involved in cell wall biosynthesis